MDLDSLLSGSTTASDLIDPAAMLAPLMPFVILTTIASIVIGVLYIFNVITTYRSHKATIETRDILREMNERDKARSLPPDPESNSKTDYAATDSATGTSSSDES